jgi:SAM-dependent methyltransferase
VSAPLFFLDEPHHHHFGDRTRAIRFRGAALAIDGREIVALRILHDGARLAETPTDKPCPELAFLPFPRAGQCRFEIEVGYAEPPFELRALYASGEEEAVFQLGETSRKDIWPCIDRLPKPSPELVAATQGGGDVRSYLDSMAAGLHTLETLLRKSLADPDQIRAILDIGCGTGRLLMGWHCADAGRRLTGVDINPELIAWSKANLPGEWAVCDLLPPLPLDQERYDLVQLASVFTHLPLDHQRAWIAEIRRVLKQGGHLVITLHGAVYARLFAQSGEYSELPTGDVGSNAFATFHTREFAESLFEGFELRGYFERGHDGEPPALFPIAALQDVYVLRKV